MNIAALWANLNNLYTTFKNTFNDGVANSFKIIDHEHHEEHEGRAFLVIYSVLKDNTDYLELRFRPNHPTRRCHMTIVIESALAMTAELWLATTKNHVVANAITPLNRDFTNPHSSVLSVCHTPSGVQAGTADITEYSGAASVSGKIAVGGSARTRGEFILRPWQDYLIKVTSRADGNALSVYLDWYEHEDKRS